MTDSDEWTAPEAEHGISSLDYQASRVDTAMVFAWVGLALVPCCGLGGIISLIAVILGISRLRAVGGRDRGLAGRARGAITIGVIGTLLGAAIVTWFFLTMRQLDTSEVTCFFTPCD